MATARKRATAASKAEVAAASDDARAAQLSAFIKSSKAGDVFTFDGSSLTIDVPVISTGAPSLDVALGVGGLPRGRLIEIYGPESVGKTSLALSVAANAVKDNGMAAIIDVEHAISKDHVRSMGVDPDYLAISQPASGEEAFTLLERFLDADMFDVIIVDSVAMLVPQAEIDGEMSDQLVGAQARLVSRGLRKVMAKIGKSKAVVIFINQLRTKIGVLYGNPEDTPGGKALKYQASIRLDVRAAAGDRIKDPRDARAFIGLGTRVKVVKNKVAPPQREARYNLIWGKGIDYISSAFEAAKDLGALVLEPGNSYRVAATGEVLTNDAGAVVRGAANVQALLAERPALARELAEACYATLRDRGEGSGAAGPIPDSDFDDEAALAALEAEESAQVA